MLCVVTFFVGLTLSHAQDAQASFPLQTYTLDNGLVLVVIPDHRWAAVAHMVWYRVGAVDEPKKKSGLAHLLEHLMFDEKEDVVARLGGEENAFTSQDFTVYHQKVGSEHLHTMMRMEAERMKKLVFKNFEEEQSVVLQERRTRLENNPVTLLWAKIDAALFAPHPYAHPVIGSQKDILGATPADVLWFYERYYSPDNALVVVAGDVKPHHALALAQKTYGKVPPRPKMQKAHPAPGDVAQKKVFYADPHTTQPVLLRRYRLGSSFKNWERSIALDVFLEAFAGNASAPLVRALVHTRKVATSVGLSARGWRRGPGSLSLWAVPAPAISLSALEAALDEELRRTKIAPKNFERAKKLLQAQFIYARDDPFVLARLTAKTLSLGAKPNDVRTFSKTLKKIPFETVTQLGQELFKKPYVTGFLETQENK